MLKKYNAEHFPILKHWITDKDILFQYSGTYFSFPITEQQITDYIQKHPDRLLYIGYTENSIPFAFGEIIPKENNPPRLARVLIGDPKLRGIGLGEKFVRELIQETINVFKSETIDLFVLIDNIAAIKCYQKIGFEFLPDGGFQLEFEGETHLLKKMRLHVKTSKPS